MIFRKKISPCDIFERHPVVEWRLVENAILLMDKKEGELIRLNEVGSQIWAETDGRQSVEEIVRKEARLFMLLSIFG